MAASYYRKKPVVIQAMRFTGHIDELVEFCAAIVEDADGLYVDTLEGDMRFGVGDFIIRGVRGEFYPCRADIFLATYEAVDE